MRREKFCLDRAIFNFMSSQQIEFFEIPQVVFLILQKTEWHNFNGHSREERFFEIIL